MLYMVIERFKEGGIREVYQRFAERGRMLPPGLKFIDSWVSADLRVCWQLMQTDSVGLFDHWTSQWDDLAEFEIVPVVTSSQARRLAETHSA